MSNERLRAQSIAISRKGKRDVWEREGSGKKSRGASESDLTRP